MDIFLLSLYCTTCVEVLVIVYYLIQKASGIILGTVPREVLCTISRFWELRYRNGDMVEGEACGVQGNRVFHQDLLSPL